MIDIHHLGAFIVTVVTSPFVIVLGVIILFLRRSVSQAHASRTWPSVNGRVLSTAVNSHRNYDNDGMHTTIYTPAVVYEYTVNQKQFESSQINIAGIDGTSAVAWAQSVVDRYPAGSQVKVFYNPLKPATAVLQNDGSAGVLQFIIAILSLVILVLLTLITLGLTGHFGS